MLLQLQFYITPSEEYGLSKLVFKGSTELVPSFCKPESFTPNFLWHTSSVKWTVLGHPRPKLNKIIFSIKPSGPV